MFDNSNTKAEIFEEYKRLINEAREKGIDYPSKAGSCTVRSTKADLLSAVLMLEKCIDAGEPEQMTIDDISYGEEKPVIKQQNDNIENKEAPEPREFPEVKIIKEDEELKLLNQDIVEKIHSLEQARSFREKEYSEVLTFEKELEKTVSMLNSLNESYISEENALNERLQEEKCETEKEIEELDKELGERREEAEKRLSELKEGFENRKSERDEMRKTETEAYLYDLKILRSKEDDAWDDEKNKRNAAIDSLEEEIKRLNDEIKEKESIVPALKEKLDRLPGELQKAREEGAAVREKELEQEFSHKASILKMDADAEIKSLERSIESLNEDYEALKAEREVIREKLDKAYEESNKLYLQTIQSTGGVKIISNLDKK